MVIWLYGQKVVQVCQYPTTFCHHKYCGSGDIMVLVCHVILQDNMTKGWSNTIGRSPSWQVTSLLSLVAIGTVAVKIWFRLSRDLTRRRDQRVMWLYGHEPIKVSYNSATFGGHRHCGSGNIMVLVFHVTLQDHVIKESCDGAHQGKSPLC